MANPKHLEILKRGVEEWNKWRKEHRQVLPNLQEAKLSKTDLRDARLGGADLSEADLTDANLCHADLSEAKLISATLDGTQLLFANLRSANLSGANLARAQLTGADLRGANLCRAGLDEANINRVRLGGANFTNARLWDTQFVNVDLREADGLETVEHAYASTIGIDTIYKSRGKIPEVFLRGCGVPDEFIAYIGSMVGRPIEFYSCFISYSTKDQEFADRLYADLQSKGVRCWFAPHDIHGGRKIHEQLDEAIRLHDKLLLILSESCMASNWVKTEIANARAREEREGKQLLFPITIAPFVNVKDWKLFDADRGLDSAREIREYFIPDFSNWKDHDSYQAAFEKLVRDLKAETQGRSAAG